MESHVCKPSSGLIFESFNQVTLVFHGTYSDMAWPPALSARRLKRGRASGKQPDCATKREALSVCYRGAARSGVRLLAGRTMPRFEQPEWRDLR